MIRQNQKIINFLNIVSDAVLTFFSYFAALYVRFEILHGQSELLLFSPGYMAIMAAYSGAVVFIYLVLRMYGSFRFKEPGSEILTILLVNGVAVLTFMAFLYVTRVMDFPRLAVFLFWLFSSLLVIGKRIVGRSVLRHYRKLGYNQKHLILVGSGSLAKRYLEDLAENPYLGFTVDGCLASGTGLQQRVDPAFGCPCLGEYGDLERVLAKYPPDEVIIALEPHETAQIKPILEVVEKEGIRVSLIPFYSEYIPSRPMINIVGRSKLIDLRSTPLDNLGWLICKRGMDIIGSLILIILTSPIMIATAIGVKISSPGPVLFRQERVGKDKKPFQMLKFRSMRVTDTEDTGWSTDADPRKTRFGSFIRKCSIDELPQLLNTLIGDMSLVGPRPEIPYHVQHFKEEIPLYLVRQQVRPGITGWAQVNGLRGDTSIEERVKYDIWYIENWSLWLDIRILFRTAFGGMVNKEKVVTKHRSGQAGETK